MSWQRPVSKPHTNKIYISRHYVVILYGCQLENMEYFNSVCSTVFLSSFVSSLKL